MSPEGTNRQMPPENKTDYVIYISAKQWKAVAGTLSDPEDALIIEGFPRVDTESSAIAAFATAVTLKKLQAAKRQAPSASAKQD